MQDDIKTNPADKGAPITLNADGSVINDDTPVAENGFLKVARKIYEALLLVQEKLSMLIGRALDVTNVTADHTNAAGSKGHIIGGSNRSLRKANALLYTVGAFVLIGLTWASLAELDRMTRGNGKVVPSRQVQLIQNLEGGIINKILVREGEVVEKGDPLFILDNTSLKSQLDKGRQRQLALQAKIIRLRAQVDQVEPFFPDEIVNEAPDVVTTETLLFAGRKESADSQIRFLKGQIRQRLQELEETSVIIATTKKGIEFAQSEMNMMAPLFKSGLEPETTKIKLNRTLSDLKGKKASAEHALKRIKASIQESQDRVVAEQEKYRTEALGELSKATNEMSEVEKAMPALLDKVTRTELRAPMRGVINRLLVNTEGGVAKPGEPLAELVPLDDSLVIEANVKPSDIAFLYVGQKVRVNITAYDFAKYGGLEGELINISADAVKVSDTESMYVIQVRTNTSSISYNDEKLEIIPGMVAEVGILTGKQTIMEYILTPILKVKDRAFRE